MKTVITTQDLEPLPMSGNDFVNQPSGLLNSNYKQLVKRNFKRMSSRSVFGIRQRMKSRQFNTCCSIETILKVGLFTICLIVAYY